MSFKGLLFFTAHKNGAVLGAIRTQLNVLWLAGGIGH
jgi:hypothetical protein